MGNTQRSERFLNDAMDTYGASVYRLALCQTRNPADAEDVFQEVFLRLLKDPTDFQSREHLKAWLLRVTINRSRDLLGSAWFRRTAPLDELIPAKEAAPGESGLWEAIAALPQKYRAAVHLYYVEGYSTEEVAQITHVNPTTVRTRLHRARQLLKTKLGGNEDDADGLQNHDEESRGARFAQRTGL